MSLPIGQPAPDFSLAAADGTTVRLSNLRGRPVVLFFYPKDETPGCTAEACAFRDRHAELEVAGAVVLGVSGDSAASHQAFGQRHGLPYRLLSDPDGAARRAYQVPATLGLLPGRMTFVIDQEGVLRHAYNAQFRPQRHVDEALAALRAMG